MEFSSMEELLQQCHEKIGELASLCWNGKQARPAEARKTFSRK